MTPEEYLANVADPEWDGLRERGWINVSENSSSTNSSSLDFLNNFEKSPLYANLSYRHDFLFNNDFSYVFNKEVEYFNPFASKTVFISLLNHSSLNDPDNPFNISLKLKTME